MAVFFPVRSDMRRILLGTPGLPVVAWEGRKFEAASGVPWVKEMLQPVSTETATLSSTGYQRETFVYALVINYPVESAIISELEDLADRLMYRYPIGYQVGSPSVHGRVLRASRTPLFTSPEWLQLTVRITAFFHRGNVLEPV